MSNFTVKFTLSVNTDNCDPDVLDEVEAHVQDAVFRLLESKFPSGDFGPDQSYSEVDFPSISVEAEEFDCEVCAFCGGKDCPECKGPDFEGE